MAHFMSQKPLVQKLLIKESHNVLLINSPSDYQTRLGNAKITTDLSAKPFDLIQLFVSSKKQLEEQLPKTKLLLKDNGLLWVTYPKGGKTDVNRDSIREYATKLDFQTVSLVSVDDTWSALRMKRLKT